MDQRVIRLPRRIAIGRGLISSAGELFSDFGLESPLVLCDSNTRAIAGNSLMASLSSLKPGMEIVKEASVQEARRISSLSAGRGAIVSVGGGSVIDVGKLAAFESGKEFVSVPTALSHDGIVSAAASLTEQRGKGSFRASPPGVIIADVDVLSGAPYRMTASGYADVVSNLTSVFDWRLGHEDRGEYFSEYSASLALLSADIAMKSADLIRGREERGIRRLVQALLSSGISMSLARSSRPASGAEHAFSHALDSMGSQALHGEQCGLGSILMACWQGQDWERIRSSLRQAGAPTTAGELGLDRETLLKALLEARKIRDRYTILDRKPLDREKALELCRSTGVI
jgi:glycerol-1-phosphate dehydrogenase [NAD(P)+]